MESFLEIIGVVWVAFWLYWLVSAIWTRGNSGNRQLFAIRIGLVFLIIAWFVIVQPGRGGDGALFTPFVPDTPVTGAAGILITIAGLLFAVWARVHLGRYWSPVAEIQVDHRLIRSGPYRYVRNPIYTGILTGFVGTAIVIGLWVAVLACVVGFIAFLLKIRSEEKLLLEKFGGEYVRYRQEVKSLIPWVI
ncbi:MAG TPA: isoprenylcysteine carboxylmethyltransferase family protein [Methanoregula sp.]|nr:isoprenylcysteine carboxylmethyltransferase family protein [Methanoregula sp.]